MVQTVAVGLSGGVDSTLSALLLKEQGFHVIGLTMSVYDKSGKALKTAGKACYGPDEKEDIQAVRLWGERQGIETYVLDCSAEYKAIVLNYFKESYLSGITPNPCIKCNETMKFGLMCDKARQEGIAFDYFATGHYARILKKENACVLQKGVDEKKDQSYFLYRLSQNQLAHTLFPLGNFTKEQVRQMARERNLAVADKADSQDFYAGAYTDLLDTVPKEGNIVHTSGKVLGKHNGFWNYTIGQRKGLGIAYPVPLFVVDINAEHNEVIVGEAEATLGTEAVVQSLVFGGGITALEQPTDALVKYRSSGKCVKARLIQTAPDSMTVQFAEPQRSVTRGQSLVAYDLKDGISVLLGGIIQ